MGAVTTALAHVVVSWAVSKGESRLCVSVAMLLHAAIHDSTHVASKKCIPDLLHNELAVLTYRTKDWLWRVLTQTCAGRFLPRMDRALCVFRAWSRQAKLGADVAQVRQNVTRCPDDPHLRQCPQ